MSESRESKQPPGPAAPPAAPVENSPAGSEDAESRRANRNFLIWWIGLPLLVMLLVVLLRDRI